MHAVIIVCDPIHLNLLGCYGSDRLETPAFDRFAHDGFTFDFCLSDSPCWGAWLEASATGFPSILGTASTDRSRLAELFEQRGVASAFFSNHPRRREAPAGFAAWRQFQAGTVKPVSLATLQQRADFRLPPQEDEEAFAYWTDHWRRLLADEDSGRRALDQVFDAPLAWLAQHRDQATLTWIEVALGAESDWLPEPLAEEAGEENPPIVFAAPAPGFVGDLWNEEDLAGLRAGHAARILAIDQRLDRFCRGLAQLDLGPDCLVVLTADQGMPLGEHGVIGDARRWLYEERIHVPLIIQYPPGRRTARSPALVQTLDLLPTLREFFGLEERDSTFGRSLLPLLRGEPVAIRDYAVVGLEDAEFALQTHQWKLMLPFERDELDAELRPNWRELYAKPEDRWDMNDVAEQSPEPADQLELQLRRYVEAVRRGNIASIPPLREGL